MSWANGERELGGGGLAVSPYPSPPQTTSTFSQRRRSSAAHTRPAAPPPNLPIPSIPDIPQDQSESSEEPTLFARPTRSSSFAQVAPSAQPRLMVQSPSNSPASSSVDDLSDPPPQSFLPSSSSRLQDPPLPQTKTPAQVSAAQTEHLAVPAVDGLLMPPENRPEARIPSPRRALTRALELAREAVQLDSMNDNPELAVAAYGRSVALLSEVMERVRRGEESTESSSRRKNGRRRSVFAQEDEIRRLQAIHDTYADRMNILSIIYSIQPVPYNTTNVYSPNTHTHTTSTSIDSTTSTSPTNSSSPSSDDVTDPVIARKYSLEDTQDDVLDYRDHADEGMAAIGAAMFMKDLASPTRSEISGLPSPGAHPYASAPALFEGSPPAPPSLPIAVPAPSNASGRSAIRRSTRSSSNLPPPPPPPSKSPPNAPTSSPHDTQPVTSHSSLAAPRPRGESVIGHRRTGSGSKLASLEEEEERYLNSRQSTIRDSKYQPHGHDSPPLPALPSPSPPLPTEAPGTPRITSKPPPSPRLAHASRSRGSSTISTRSDGSAIINPTPTQGTIYQRRPKTSGPSTPRSSSPAESTTSVGSVPLPRPVTSSLPSSTTSLVTTRSRSSSQPPGRRPSIGNGRISPSEERPPLPNTANGILGVPAPPPRLPKPPLNTQALTVQTDLAMNAVSLAPMSAVAPGVPLTPTSPLPPVPPTDPLRKPYHLMNLLRTTMVSGTGGYITRRLHVPQEVWSQGGAKLGNLGEKVRVIDILCTALEELQEFSSDCFGAGNVSSGMALGIGSVGRKEGEAWIAKLEDFSTVCDGVVANFGKKLGVGEGFVVKKTTWGDKLGRRFDKLTNGKNLDSPAAYVQGLKKLFLHAQLLDEHTQAVTSTPVAPAYGALPGEIRSAADHKLKRSSEFFASVVLTFVIRDLSMLLDKYAKKCEKWLAE